MAETKAQTQAEPTMEEILASIRRIISEDDPVEEGQEGAAEAEADAAEEAPAPEPAPAADDVLELTQKLNDDGSVVDLADQPAAEAAPEPEVAAEPEPEPAPEAEPEPEPAAEPEMAAEPESAPEPEPEMAADADPFADVTPAAPAEDEESLLAPETQVATAGALGAIGKAVASNRQAPVQVGDGRTLEAIVREALTPELKAWLDANLAPLVEQIVREEIKKMVRRAEDQ